MDARAFLETYEVTDIEKDPLPIKVLRNSIIKEEIPGQAIHWGFDYLDQRQCPLSLTTHILEKLYQEVHKSDFSSCAEPTGDSLDGSNSLDAHTKYEPLKLMRAVVKILDEICVKEKEDYHDSVDGLVESPDMQPHVFAVSYSNIKNTRRFMEDRMTVLPRMDRIFNLPMPISYFAVFDGHNGSEAAAYGAAQLHQYLIHSLSQHQDVIPSISDAFENLDEAFIQKCRSGKVKSGSTVVLSLLMPDKLYIAWLGDSQAVLVKQNEVANLVIPHKPERMDEIDRIKSMGGEVIQMNGTYRVNGNLAVSRAIGDADDKTFIISTPDIKMLELDGSEEFLILACDGLWDEVSPEGAADIVRRQIVADPSNVSAISQKLITQAKQRGSTDNISVIVVFLEPLESIRNRYEGVLDPNMETEFTILKQVTDPLGIKPMAEFIENSADSPIGLEMNGHSKDSDRDQLVDFLSFGSSRESGAQVISDDTGNQSGDDEKDVKEVEELSDAESDDEWQFEKPVNNDMTATTTLITGNGIGENPFSVDEPTNDEAVRNNNMADLLNQPATVEETILVSNIQPVEKSNESFNPFSGDLIEKNEEVVPSVSNEQLTFDDLGDVQDTVSHDPELDITASEAFAKSEGVFDATFVANSESASIEPEPMNLPNTLEEKPIDTLLEPKAEADQIESKCVLFNDMIQDPVDRLNPFNVTDEPAPNAEADLEPGIPESAAGESSNLIDTVVSNSNPEEESQQHVASNNPFGYDNDFAPVMEPMRERVEFKFDADETVSSNINASAQMHDFGQDMEYFAQVETNPIPEGLVDEPERNPGHEEIFNGQIRPDGEASVPQRDELTQEQQLVDELTKPEPEKVHEELVFDHIPAPVHQENPVIAEELVTSESRNVLLEDVSNQPEVTENVKAEEQKEEVVVVLSAKEDVTEKVSQDLREMNIPVKNEVSQDESRDSSTSRVGSDESSIEKESESSSCFTSSFDSPPTPPVNLPRGTMSDGRILELQKEANNAKLITDSSEGDSDDLLGENNQLPTEIRSCPEIPSERQENVGPEEVPEAKLADTTKEVVQEVEHESFDRNRNLTSPFTPLEDKPKAGETLEALVTEAPVINGNLTPDAPSPVEEPVIEATTAKEVASAPTPIAEDTQKIEKITTPSDDKKTEISAGKPKSKPEGKSVGKTTKSPTKPELSGAKPGRASLPSTGAKKSPTKPTEPSSTKPLLNGKSSPSAAKPAPSKPAAATTRPTAAKSSTAGATTSKPATSRIGTTSASRAPIKTTTGEAKAPSKVGAPSTLKPRTTAPTAPRTAAPPAKATTAGPTSPKKTGPAVGLSGPRPTSARPGTATSTISGTKTDAKAPSTAAPKPRPRPPTTATKPTDSKPETKKPITRTGAPPTAAPRPTASRPATAPRTTTITAKPSAPTRTTGTAPGTGRTVGTKPAPKPAATTGSRLNATRPQTASAKVPPTTGAKKIDTSLKPKRPTTAGKPGQPKPVPKSAEKTSLVETENSNAKTEESAVSGVNGTKNGETDEMEKTDPVKENGIHEGSTVDPHSEETSEQVALG